MSQTDAIALLQGQGAHHDTGGPGSPEKVKPKTTEFNSLEVEQAASGTTDTFKFLPLLVEDVENLNVADLLVRYADLPSTRSA